MLELTFNQVKPFLFADLKAGQTPALMGEAGIGKSSLIEDLAREFKTKVFTLPVNQLADRADLTGVRMIQDENGNWGQSFFPHTTIMASIAYAEQNPDENPILFLDEFNRASSDITSAILSFQTLRRIGTIDFPENLRLVVAGNDRGNVTALDKASITRFAVYRVKPDLQTFLSVQELNPFVEEVLTKYPETLMAPQLYDNIESDDDDDDDNNFDLSSEYLEEDGFEQATVPRTISYTSEWLNMIGIDKSGSDQEMDCLKNLMSDTTADNESSVLRAGLMAHAGRTTFTENLYNVITEYFYATVNGKTTAQKPLLQKIRPKQDIINELNKATDTTAVSNILQGMSDDERMNLLVWSFESRNVAEVNNRNALSHAVTEIGSTLSQLGSNQMTSLNTILANGSMIDEANIKAFINSGGPAANIYKDFISATLGF